MKISSSTKKFMKKYKIKIVFKKGAVKFDDKILFPEKLEKANRILAMGNLPK